MFLIDAMMSRLGTHCDVMSPQQISQQIKHYMLVHCI